MKGKLWLAALVVFAFAIPASLRAEEGAEGADGGENKAAEVNIDLSSPHKTVASFQAAMKAGNVEKAVECVSLIPRTKDKEVTPKEKADKAKKLLKEIGETAPEEGEAPAADAKKAALALGDKKINLVKDGEKWLISGVSTPAVAKTKAPKAHKTEEPNE
jgi:hypothetical protein